METDSVPLYEGDSCPQMELSSKEEKAFTPSHIWRGGYNRNTVYPPIYQYPYVEWVPNSICYADFQARSKTFDKWPKQLRPTKSKLIRSGFFYKGFGDKCRVLFLWYCSP